MCVKPNPGFLCPRRSNLTNATHWAQGTVTVGGEKKSILLAAVKIWLFNFSILNKSDWKRIFKDLTPHALSCLNSWICHNFTLCVEELVKFVLQLCWHSSYLARSR